MPSANDLVEATKRYLYSGYQDELNVLSGALDTTGTTINLTYDPVGIARGATIAIDLEEMYVWNVNQRALTVRRGMNGSTATGHIDGSPIHVKPKFSTFRIFQELNNELRDLSSPVNGLFRIMYTDLTYSAMKEGYDLPGDIITIQEVRYKDFVGGDYPKLMRYEMAKSMPAADFPSTTMLLLYEPAAPGRTLRVKYRAPFALLTALTNDVATTTGLPDTAMDIPPLGAALRLVAPREIKRNFTEAQGEPRRAEEVPPNAVANSFRGLAGMRAQRILSEAMRLAAMYPSVRG